MQGRRLAAAAAVMTLVATASFAAGAATGPKIGPKGSWDDMQKFEFYIGQTGSALNLCRDHALANDLKKLADLSPYGRQGWQSLLSFDGLRGAQCGRVAANAEAILADRDQLWDYLTEKYDCPAGECPPEDGDESVAAACRPEAERHLASLPVTLDDVKSVRMVRRFEGVTLLTTGRPGHEAWVRLNSCSGWLVIELSKGCYPQQSFTRGGCQIEGISRY